MASTSWTSTAKRAEARTIPFDQPYLLVKALGSLKITVTLFALAILIVLIGTLAQDEETLVQVKRQYFNSWIAWVPVDVFFPQTLWPHDPLPGKFPFPGGAAIGLALLINLIAAKTTRFSLQARGLRFWSGVLISLLGTGLVTAVITAGHTADGLQGQPPISYDQLWTALKLGLVFLTFAAAGYAVWAKHLPGLAKWVLWLGVASLAVVSLGLHLGGQSVRLDDPGLRIVWQLLQASIASCVVLVGMVLLFGKRGGNMLIHVGVALLMVGQFVFGDRQIEQRITLVEGDESNMVFMMDELEIAMIDVSRDDEDQVKAIPDALIRRAVRRDGVIDDPNLPCIVRIDQWMTNSVLKPLSDGENPATHGIGLELKAVETAPSGAAQSAINLASAYVTLIDRETDQPLATVLLSQMINDRQQVFRGAADRNERIKIEGVPYELALRFRREYKDYSVHLKDVVRENYSGSDTPRDFSSLIRIRNNQTGEEITEKTWMNNPIRFGGETFYQSDYFPAMLADGQMGEGSGLQIVKNAGWVIPYICCMMVMVGMLYHFGGTFNRYANRVARESVAQAASESSTKLLSKKSLLAVAGGLSIVAVATGFALRSPQVGVSEVDWSVAAQLPVQHEGRIKPADTVATNVLQTISEPIFGGSATVRDADGRSRPRVEWLLAVMADVPWTRDVPVFRVYAKEVRDLLGLEDRSGYRYSFNEIQNRREDFFEQIEKLREKSKNQEELTFREKKISEMYQKLTSYELLSAAYEQPALPSLSDAGSEEGVRRVMAQLDLLDRRYKVIQSMHPPAFIPPLVDSLEQDLSDRSPKETWVAFGPARFKSILDTVRGIEVNPAIDGFEQVLVALQKEDSKEINTALKRYQKQVSQMATVEPHLGRTSMESWLNHFNPTSLGIMLYLLAIVVGIVSFSGRGVQARNVAFGILVGVFVIHTVTLLARMYISGRAPVTNLYSSAVFIGWACVLFCLILEMVHRMGVANIVAGLIGLITLVIARSLDKGDTLHVLAAVLDTQFWLSTHVVTVTAGYAVTYLAGFFGAVALVHMMLTRNRGPLSEASQRFQQQIYRMAYFSVCFGILFSFVGTVLGGLWADDSWGRFWGWDPKENGALMIVLWNALMLHARWDKMVGLRGFSMLALVGNLVTSWSWFGTNLLGIGLHNYGFNKSVAFALVVTVIVHVLFIGAALILTSSKPRLSNG
jgi:ABC-type transport system involved in cytochrome c biogenesis permease subunit